MNKVTQSIYKKKVDDLENEVAELVDNPVPHAYTICFSTGNFHDITVNIYTTTEIPLTQSDMYDYMLEATKFHDNKRYNFPAFGTYRDTVSGSATYGTWVALNLGANETYPGASTDSISITFIKVTENVGNMTKKISKETFLNANVYIFKLY